MNNKELDKKCDICNKHDIYRKDYRFIESAGLQGKILSCEWCFNLNDLVIRDIIKNNLNPEDYYNDKNITVNKPIKKE